MCYFFPTLKISLLADRKYQSRLFFLPNVNKSIIVAVLWRLSDRLLILKCPQGVEGEEGSSLYTEENRRKKTRKCPG